MNITLREGTKKSLYDEVASQQAENVSEELIPALNNIKQPERGTEATEDRVPLNILLSITVVSDTSQ